MIQRYILHNVKTVDEQRQDIIIEYGIIVGIMSAGEANGEQSYDCSDIYVSSGWIDLHVHAFSKFDPYGDEMDEVGVKQGVTTIVDAGSCGADRITEFRMVTKHARTNVFAFLNISRIGLMRVDELSNLDWIDEELAIQAVKENDGFIVGLKARISQSVVKDHGIEPLRLGKLLSHKTGLPLMVHIGSGPPDVNEVLELLESNDIVTHYLNGKSNNLFDKVTGEPRQVLLDAIDRGVHLDVGHGTASFSFKVADMAKRHGIALHTISTDIYRRNRIDGPVYSMASVMSKFLLLGYSLEEVVTAVTSHAANWLNKPELGRIQVGDMANLTLFVVKNEKVTLTDSEGVQRVADQYIEAKGVITNGSYITC
ncbi:amidohydrolase/deacetylase family metallohydrolase [Paenibacillus sp. CMAA1364]